MTEIASTDEREERISQWCAVVDPKSRKVVHIHQFFPIDQSEVLTADELARQALEHVPSGRKRDGLTVVHPDAALKLEPRTLYGFEKGGQELVARPMKQRRDRSRPSRRDRSAD